MAKLADHWIPIGALRAGLISAKKFDKKRNLTKKEV
jgi:hypothetical protein